MVVLADDGASWAVQTVAENDAAYGGNGYCPIVVDSNNNPHIAYTGITPPYMYDIARYASWNGSGWITQTIREYNTAFSIVLDANDNPHVLYASMGGERLRYASWTGSSWFIQTVDENGAGFGSVALDSFGNPHIAYTNGQVLKYARQTGEAWNVQTVGPNVTAYGPSYLALDSNDNPHISVRDRDVMGNGHIMYATATVNAEPTEPPSTTTEPTQPPSTTAEPTEPPSTTPEPEPEPEPKPDGVSEDDSVLPFNLSIELLLAIVADVVVIFAVVLFVYRVHRKGKQAALLT